MGNADLKTALRSAEAIVNQGLNYLRKKDNPEQDQVFLYELAHARSALSIAQGFSEFAEKGDNEKLFVELFCADTFKSLSDMCFGRETLWEISIDDIQLLNRYVATYGSPMQYSSAANLPVKNHLNEELQLVAETFRRFGKENIEHHAESVHREDLDVPESIISGLAELGCFGLSIPERYGGTATGTTLDNYGMVIATEELSRASLSIGGSLITRPEILARAIENGGTDDQKQRLLPLIASGECMSAVAVTEPDFGSDVAGITTNARRLSNGDWEINGVKTWCTFAGKAGVIMVVARTEEAAGHKGLSILLVEKPSTEEHAFEVVQEGGGRMTGKAIPTIGYRGMHSYDMAYENFFVPDANLLGEEGGRGKGFYMTMAGMTGGRIQTAARACGVMAAAIDAALQYAGDRKVFGNALGDYQLTQARLAVMAARYRACRALAYEVAELMDEGEGQMQASLVKLIACRSAEIVTRDALQIFGGMGYAEETSVSRYFVDARVLSIFEGAEETLAMKVVARELLNRAQ